MGSPSTTSNLNPRIPELPADVILTILEELYNLQCIFNLRLVSKHFDALVVPLSYRHVHLTDRVVGAFASNQELQDTSITQLQVAHDVRSHTRHLTINRALDWSLVARLVESLANLHSFTWAFWDHESTSLHESPNATLGPALCKTWPHVQLHFDGLRALKYQPSAYSSFPNSNLISCKLTWKQSETPMIEDLLFERPRLQQLHLIEVPVLGSGHIMLFYPKIEAHQDQTIKRLPALKALIIDGYNWDHSPWESTNLWDWSNITYLELRDVQVINFLSRIQPRNFSGLKSFIETCTSNWEESLHRSKSTMLLRLVRHTTALEELEITCDTQNTPVVSTIAQHCLHLRTLSLRSFSIHEESWWNAISVDQLSTIGSACPQLMEIKLDLTFPTIQCVPSASSRFRLRTATTSTSTIMTRSMSRAEIPKRNANDTDRYQLGDGGDGDGGEAEAKQEIPRWYMGIYLKEGPGHTHWSRYNRLRATAREQRIPYKQARNEYLAWKRRHYEEEVAALRNQVHSDPTPTLAKSRNLRRLSVFTRLSFVAVPDCDEDIHVRTREMVQNWLNGLLLTKQGAQFEEVTFYVASRMVSEDVDVKTVSEGMTYRYAGGRNADGAAEISEGFWCSED